MSRYKIENKKRVTIWLLLKFPELNWSSSCALLFDNIQNGICFKKIEISYLALGRDPLNERNDSIAIMIKTITQNTPYTSMSFLYRGPNYYISVHKRCKTINL